MGRTGNIVLRFTEDKVNLSIVKKSGRNITITESREFALIETTGENGELVYSDIQFDAFKSFIAGEKLTAEEVQVIIAQDGIITRLIQSPVISKKDLDKFITNNIEEYFTLNIEDYDYDYTIVNEEKGEVKKFTILLVLFPKNKLKAIVDYVIKHNLEIDTLTIYPVCIEKFFHGERDKSIAVFDIGENKANITILEKGSIFLYSRTNSEIDLLQGEFDEVLDSMLYFLNFYSTRHFGNRVDKIYITGKLWNNQAFLDELKELIPVSMVSGIKLTNGTIETKEGIDKNLFADIIGAVTPIKRKYNRDINFARFNKEKIKRNENLPIAVLAAVLLVISILWPVGFLIYKDSKLKKLDTTALIEEKVKLHEVDQRYNELLATETELNQREEAAKLLEEMDIDYTPYIEALRKALPSTAYIKSFHIDPENVSLNFIVSGTIDKVILAESINKIEIFEKVNIETIKLDDTEREAQFQLKIIKPYKGE
ncbi:type IV pilus biogenesis protein PilM [Clostridium thermarum]|uniref:type IV pilus biogenesis protein PilM n=1 Tax=Clostridium thermarum TaxID=1716543 RepID=UPI00111F283B|nr:pilus assembly protein PilM [Clostridium thermarum]